MIFNPSDGDAGRVVGFLELCLNEKSDQIMHSFSMQRIGAIENNMVDCATVSFDSGLTELLGPLVSKKWFADKFRGYKEVSAFTQDLKRLVQDALEQKSHEKAISGGSSSSSIAHSMSASNAPAKGSMSDRTIMLMDQIARVGWKHVRYINEEMNKIVMVAWDSMDRQHVFDVTIDDDYPASCPSVSAALPVPVILQWAPPAEGGGGGGGGGKNRKNQSFASTSTSNNLCTVLQSVQSQIDKYALLFDVLSDIDAHCWVLEPLRPSFATSRRRIVIEKTCSVLLEINPGSPLAVCEMRFMGPPDKVRKLQAAMSKNLHLWKGKEEHDSSSSGGGGSGSNGGISSPSKLRESLEAVLEVKLPASKRKRGEKRKGEGLGLGNVGEEDEDEDEEGYAMECGICYSFAQAAVDGDGDGDGGVGGAGHESVAPDQVCPKATCQRMYHYRCLFGWLQAVPSSRSSFGTLFGHCPYCGEWLSVKGN